MMRKIVQVVLALSLITMVAVPAFGWDNVDHVKLSPNSRGDLIWFPFYLTANGGWETKLTVTNTHPSYSVVAKVIFHSWMYSEETFDFLLYLTPDDVWTGFVQMSGTSVILHSTDDSMLAANGSWASASNPVNQPINQPTCTSIGDSISMGYIEIVESWFCDVSQANVAAPAPPAGQTWSRVRPVTKAYVKQLYDNNQAPVSTANEVQGINFGDRTVNVLTGQMEFQNPAAGLVGSMRASVFADWNNLSVLTAANATGIFGSFSRNDIGELEAAMSGNDYIMSYVNDTASGDVTAHVFTFPTKNTVFEQNTGDPNFCEYINGNPLSPFWLDPVPVNNIGRAGYRCATYAPALRDTMENGVAGTPYSGGGQTYSLCNEVNILDSSSFVFDEGFVRYTFPLTGKDAADIPTRFDTQDGLSVDWLYTGIPALATIVYFRDGGMAMKEGARTDGTVVDTVAVDVLEEYQYHNLNTTISPAFAAGDPNTTFIGPSF